MLKNTLSIQRLLMLPNVLYLIAGLIICRMFKILILASDFLQKLHIVVILSVAFVLQASDLLPTVCNCPFYFVYPILLHLDHLHSSLPKWNNEGSDSHSVGYFELFWIWGIIHLIIFLFRRLKL